MEIKLVFIATRSPSTGHIAGYVVDVSVCVCVCCLSVWYVSPLKLLNGLAEILLRGRGLAFCCRLPKGVLPVES